MADMSRPELVKSFKLSLCQAVDFFDAAKDADFERLLDSAAADLAVVRPYRVLGSIVLSAGLLEYDTIPGLQRITMTHWGQSQQKERKPWNSNYPCDLPELKQVVTADGIKLRLSRAPTAAEIADYGQVCEFEYIAPHVIADQAAETTIPEKDRGLLILAAQIEACHELAMRQIGKPVSLRDGVNQQPRSAHPTALAEQLRKVFIQTARGGVST